MGPGMIWICSMPCHWSNANADDTKIVKECRLEKPKTSIRLFQSLQKTAFLYSGSSKVIVLYLSKGKAQMLHPGFCPSLVLLYRISLVPSICGLLACLIRLPHQSSAHKDCEISCGQSIDSYHDCPFQHRTLHVEPCYASF